MKSISVTELKAKLSAQMRYVRHGHQIAVTDRGKTVALIVPFEPSDDAVVDRLEELGLARRPIARLPPEFWKLTRPEDREGSVRAGVLAEREGGW